MDKLYTTVINYYDTSETLRKRLMITISLFYDLLIKNRQLTMENPGKESDFRLMVSLRNIYFKFLELSHKEVYRFSSEYLTIIDYFKTFMGSIMRKTQIYLTNLEASKSETISKINRLKEYISNIKIQTNNLTIKLKKETD